jgi:hypothetical protein
MPNHDAPQKLVEAWLEFHRSKLCQSIDAVFVFNKQGMEIWCLSEEEKKLRKFRRLFEPLQSAYQIDIYATRPPVHQDSDKDPAPPPSLSENLELRKYLNDPEARLRDSLIDEDLDKEISPPKDILKRHLILYAERILLWNARMKQSAIDLPELIKTALDPRQTAHVSAQASAIGAVHVKDLIKNLSKLSKNLAYAFPKSSQKDDVGTEPDAIGQLPIAEYSEYIAGEAKDLARAINNFIFPDQHTVDLSDLRRPRILDLLRNLESKVLDFQKELAKLPASTKSR